MTFIDEFAIFYEIKWKGFNMKLGEFIKKNRLSDAMHYDMCFSCDDEQFLLDLIDVDDKNQKINVKLYREQKEDLDSKKSYKNRKKKSTVYEILTSRGVLLGIDEIVALYGKENLKVEIENREPERFVIVVKSKGDNGGIEEIKQLYNFYYDVDTMAQIDAELFNYINNLPEQKETNRKKKSRHKVNEKFVKVVNEGFNSGSPDTKIIVKIPYSGVSNKISYFLEHNKRKWQMNEETYKAIVESFKKEVNEDNQTISEQNNILAKALRNISIACIELDYINLPKNLLAIINKITSRGGLIDSVEVNAGLDPLYDENGSPITHKTKWFGYKLSDEEWNMLGKQTLYEIYNLLKPFNSDDINMNEKEKNIIDSVVGENGIIPQTFKKLNMKFK